jgi:hypothetical protein
MFRVLGVQPIIGRTFTEEELPQPIRSLLFQRLRCW